MLNKYRNRRLIHLLLALLCLPCVLVNIYIENVAGTLWCGACFFFILYCGLQDPGDDF